ncbi:MAG: hypothetical protein IKZ47_01185 [Clostridia bacterium]|nr:hypothetical protein [Clostridia bacterium]
MEENKVAAQPQAETEETLEEGGENRSAAENGTVSVKFNKEIKKLTADEAATLAQKGMKFEMIENDFSRLRTLAAKNSMSVSEYINHLEDQRAKERKEELLKECGGNEELAEHVMELENFRGEDDGLDELREYFPTVRSLSDLPRAVVETARLKGENLLKSYLTYRLLRKRQAAEQTAAEKSAESASVGSQKGGSDRGEDDFIRALWGR